MEVASNSNYLQSSALPVHIFSWPLLTATSLHNRYWLIPAPQVYSQTEQTCNQYLLLKKTKVLRATNSSWSIPHHKSWKIGWRPIWLAEVAELSQSYLSRVPLLNHEPASWDFSSSSFIDLSTRAACSSATFKCVMNGFKKPEAIFSVFPFPETNNSHLQKVIFVFTRYCQKIKPPNPSWRSILTVSV